MAKGVIFFGVGVALFLFFWLCWDFVRARGIFSCRRWDLVPRPGIEPRPPALGTRSLDHQATREAPGVVISEIRGL